MFEFGSMNVWVVEPEAEKAVRKQIPNAGSEMREHGPRWLVGET